MSIFDDLHIFEMANNHQGQIDHGLGIIEEMAAIARDCGIRAAVKFQYRDLDSFIHPRFANGGDNADNKHIARFQQTRLTGKEFKRLVEATKKAGMLAVVTPFDEASVERCLEHDVDIIKVASCSADDWPLLAAMADTGKPIIASTGGKAFADIDNLYSFLNHRGAEFALLHCVGIYPTAAELQVMNVIDRMIKRYPGICIGYSGHEPPDDLDVVKIAVAKGARILERHVGLPTQDISLNAYSMDPAQTRKWAQAANRARALCGDRELAGGGSVERNDKPIDALERASLLTLQRGVFAKRAIAKGKTIGAEDVFFAFPCEEGRLVSGEFSPGFVASRDYAKNAALEEIPEKGDVGVVRALIHDFRGMFNEAGISIGPSPDIEISHHFGLSRFRETGALIVSVFNAHYCKKLIAMLPGQRHPVHRHKIKDETFQLLWGDLTVQRGDVEYPLGIGDTLEIPHGNNHAFWTDGGAIFEEISTTSIRGDSEYQEDAINRLDPIERKTILGGW